MIVAFPGYCHISRLDLSDNISGDVSALKQILPTR